MGRMMNFAGSAALTGVLMLWPAAATMAIEAPPGFEAYVVRPGDTLGGIANRVFGDPGRWRELLDANPQVTNPDRIYPGDTILVPAAEPEVAVEPPTPLEASGVPGGYDRGYPGAVTGPGEDAGEEAATQAGSVSAAEERTAPEAGPAAAGSPGGEGALPVERVAAVPVVGPALYRNAGYISDVLPAIAIVASAEGQLAMATGDIAVANAVAEAGARFTVVRADRRVFHPATGKPLGWLVRVLGSAEVTCTGTGTSTVLLSRMRDAAMVGDYLVPFDPDDVLEENLLPPKAKERCLTQWPAAAMIVAFDDNRGAVGEMEIAYIDKGSSSGIAPGARYAIYRERAPEGKLMVGELQVLRVSERTATALVTTSIREVEIADLLQGL